MNNIKTIILLFCLINCRNGFAQQKTEFTLADTLRGSITPERAWWDVLRYDISVTPDYVQKSIAGSNSITYKVVKQNAATKMQIDLKDPLVIDSVIQLGRKLKYYKWKSVWYVKVKPDKVSNIHQITIFYHGQVHQAIRPPWDGGFIFTKDSLGRPWMTVACQGDAGASIWYPCKDHQSDEPDNGASITMTVPDTLVAVANGRMISGKENGNGTATYKWAVVNPINNYCIIPYIGKYVNFSEKYKGEKGLLDVNYWVLDYNLNRAKAYMPDQVHKMLNAFEYWLGPYPFYEDGYKLVDAPHTGMEHQSAVAYGNYYQFGYRDRDVSYSGWGLKFDFIIVHESAHEWFGNNITSKDLADMWIHESFANYSETLYTDYNFGKDAGNEYNYGSRKGIKNDRAIIPPYGVNAEGSGDMYAKGGNMLQTIRHSIGNDSLFRSILRGLNKQFYHQTVTAAQIENYISHKANYNYKKIFDQYLRTTNIPVFEYYFNKDSSELLYHYTNCVAGFNLPLILQNEFSRLKLYPAAKWKKLQLKHSQSELFLTSSIEKMYLLKAVMLQK
ncbi:MAG TPA: M1 family metallopeptidase [Chitinophagaceae bacterium]|nr:M1 family metallopeptidase [Chitinophagaceae bacterium]